MAVASQQAERKCKRGCHLLPDVRDGMVLHTHTQHALSAQEVRLL